MQSLTNVITLQLTPQIAAIIIAVVVVLFLLLGLAGRRRRRRRRSGDLPHRPGGASRGWRRTPAARRDHGEHLAVKHGVGKRSSQWPRVAHAHLAIEPACVACGHRGEGLQVHHIKPFHLHPHLELDPTNLITLCEIEGRNHHLLIGHLDNWESFNVNVRADAKHYHGKSANAIRADLAWQRSVMGRPGSVVLAQKKKKR